MTDFDVVVAGAGITGTTLASLLISRGVVEPGRVAIIAEPQPSPPVAGIDSRQWGLRVFALSRASQRLLLHCGVWSTLPADKLFAYERMCVWDSKGEPRGHGALWFDCADIGEPNLGFIVEGRALHSQCRGAAQSAGAVLIEAAIAAITVDERRARLRLDDGREIECRLLVAADGADSPVRRLLGIETAGHAYHQDALVAHVRTTRPHRSTAWQRFLPTGPLAFLPLPDGRSSIVWSTNRTEAARLRALDAAAFGSAVTAASGESLGACDLTTGVATFPLKLEYAVDYVRPRAVLVGDAAHSVHPLAGQGLNLGLLDCAALAEVLGTARPEVQREGRHGSADHGEQRLLRRYERWRRSENMLAASALDGLERLFASPNRVVSGLRIAGLNAVARMPSLRRELALRAMGLKGDVPATGDPVWPHK